MNFDNDDDLDQFGKILEEIQKQIRKLFGDKIPSDIMDNLLHGELPEEFRRFMENTDMSDMLEGAFKQIGFSMNVGPDGVPKINMMDMDGMNTTDIFNNLNQQPKFETPYHEIMDFEDHFNIIVELPGIHVLDDVKMDFTEDGLEIIAENPIADAKYKSIINIDKSHKNDLKDVNLNNGILEISISRTE
jgi:HSP20 family molecular chaperone IbpA